jgi:hypothetical protein
MTEIEIDLVARCERSLFVLDQTAVPIDLRATAFALIFEVLSSTTGASIPGGSGSERSVAGSKLTAIAERAGCADDRIRELFSFDNEALHLTVSSRRIAKSAAQGARELTLLISGGRQAAGIEEWTPLSVARETCDMYARYDSANYAASIKEMDQLMSFRGSRSDREGRLTMPGWDAWCDLIKRILNGEGGGDT